MYLLIYLIS